MYEIVIRNVKTGKVLRLEDCFTSKLKRDNVVFWQGPDDERKEKYKIISWKWMGYGDKLYPLPNKRETFYNVADEFLMWLDTPKEWKDLIVKLRLKHKIKQDAKQRISRNNQNSRSNSE